MRVVLDTNVVVSAIVYGGNPQAILHEVISGRLDAFVSEPLVRELQDVLQRPQFGLSIQFVQNSIAEYTAVAEWVVPHVHHNLIKEDPADNLVLDCAVGAEADYIVTGDGHLLDLERCGNVKIVSPQSFVSLIAD